MTMRQFTVHPEEKERKEITRRTFEILYENWTSIREDMERTISDFWHKSREERQAYYDKLGPVFKVGMMELDTYTLRLQEDIDLYQGVADPTQVLNESWAIGYRMWPADVRRMIREVLNIERAKEEEARQAIEGEEEEIVASMGESLEPDVALQEENQ